MALVVTEPSSSLGTSMARSRWRRWPTWMMLAGGRLGCDAGEELGDERDGVLRGGEADALRRCGLAGEKGAGGEAVRAGDEGVEALEREGEVGAALVVGDGVDLVDDDGADVAEVLAGLAGGEQDVEGLGGGDEDVRRVAEHGRAIVGEGVAGADAGADLGGEIAAGEGELLDLARAGLRGSSGRRWRAP